MGRGNDFPRPASDDVHWHPAPGRNSQAVPLNSPDGRPRRRRARLSWRRRFIYGALLVSVTAGSLYVAWLDHLIATQFEGRRWNVPTRVYARPFEMKPGLPLSAAVIERELKRHGYRAGGGGQPGSFRKKGSRFEIMLREARFADRLREAQPLSIVADAQAILALEDAAGRRLPSAALEPLQVGSLFPVHGEDRVVVPPDAVPAMLPAALKVIEDRSFDSHPGIDLRAIIRAAWANFRAGRVEQGGSTLTQQLVKSYFLDERRSYGRKAREAIMALLLERRVGKAELMNAYVNEIYLGQDGERAIHGFGLASRFYFGKPLAELDLAEVALLVGIVRGPSYYNPRANAERAKARRDFVLARLAEFQVVTANEAKAAAAKPLGVVPRATEGYYPAFLDYVRRELRRELKDEPDREGLTVFTSLDTRVQALAERALEEELARLDRRRSAANLRLEGAVVVTEPDSGEVLAVVGGRHSRMAGFNRALDARRPIGSLVKPVVYLAALETGHYHAASTLYDEPIEVRLAGGKEWRPQNFDHEAEGPVPLLRALTQSRNLATVQLGMEVGLDPIARKFAALGLDREPPRLPAMLLGAVELTPLEVAQIYGSLATGGIARQPYAVHAIVTRDGTTLRRTPPAARLAAEPAAVYQLNRMLTQVMSRGTGASGAERLPEGLVTAGKTGTSSDLRDSWFAGFSGSHLVVVWIGHDGNQSTGLTGSQGALPVWATIMAGAGASSWQAAMPESLEEVWLDYKTGLVTAVDCQGVGEVVAVAVPRDADLETMAGCFPPGLEYFPRRLRDWWRRFTG